MRREKLGVTNRLVYKLKFRTFSDPDLRIAIGPKAPLINLRGKLAASRAPARLDQHEGNFRPAQSLSVDVCN
jgi:hypothetical protein